MFLVSSYLYTRSSNEAFTIIEIYWNNAGFPLTAPEFVTVSDGIENIQHKMPEFNGREVLEVIGGVVAFGFVLLATKNIISAVKVGAWAITLVWPDGS